MPVVDEMSRVTPFILWSDSGLKKQRNAARPQPSPTDKDKNHMGGLTGGLNIRVPMSGVAIRKKAPITNPMIRLSPARIERAMTLSIRYLTLSALYLTAPFT
tara:strand:- start:305 stop:610 length:306 start_codon:yes stop_codon:yes gene_type:complete